MEEALKVGWLCNYTYYPHIVKLTNLEMEKYRELSLQLLRMGLFDASTGTFRSTPEKKKKPCPSFEGQGFNHLKHLPEGGCLSPGEIRR